MNYYPLKTSRRQNCMWNSLMPMHVHAFSHVTIKNDAYFVWSYTHVTLWLSNMAMEPFAV